MTPERHRRAKEIFLLACEVAPEERAAVVERACDNVAELRELVDALLAFYREPVEGSVGRVAEVEPAARLAAGQLVDGKYVVESRIGLGGMGEVYRARQLTLDRVVVVKVLASDPNPDALRRFEREARALARLHHPHVVTAHDLGVAPDVGHYLVMEFVDGRTMRDELRRLGTLPVTTAVELMRQVCEGAAAAHAAGVIHRDLKPANILLEGDGEQVTAKVADFGIARLAEPDRADDVALTGADAVMGTAHYMSPEQCRGEDVDARSDVYALGCVLYELLTGRPPFTAESVLVLLEKHRPEAPAAVDELRSEVSTGLARVVARALEKPPERRWQSAAELGAALASVARGEEIEEAVPPPPHNVPWPLTRCIGRGRELAELRTLLVGESPRLVTITGTGGIGKTRLAVEVAHALATSFADGVFQVDLAALSDPALLAQRIAQVLGVKESAGGTMAETLTRFVREKRLLLVLDNFEHLLDEAPVVARLLEAAPRVKALVTSQAPLHLRGEREYELGALEVPALDAPEKLERSSAVALFVERARQEKPSFEITAGNARAVAEVCRRLEGLPLAIELAAARVKVLEPEAILARLEHQLAVLTGGARDLPERQQTMRAAVTWSYELLGAREMALLRELAVFSGGGTLDAAEAVCGHDVADVLEALGSLADKSLLWQREQKDAEARFGMLEVVREFALERLEAVGEAEAARMRHARYFLERALEVDPRSTSDDASQLASLGREQENLSSALGVLLDRDSREGVRMAVACRRYWFFRNLLSEGMGWMRRALASGGAGPAERAMLLAAVGSFEGFLGDHETAGELVREAVAIGRTVDDRSVLLDALNSGAVEFLTQPGRHAEAEPYLEEAIGIARAIGDNNRAASLLTNLGGVAFAEGDRERVRSCTEEALSLCTSTVLRTTCLMNLGFLSFEDGDLVSASERIREALVAIRGFGDRSQAATALEMLADIAHRQGSTEKAVRLAGAVESLYKATGGMRTNLVDARWEHSLATMRETLEPSAFERELAMGRAMGLDDAVAEALRGN